MASQAHSAERDGNLGRRFTVVELGKLYPDQWVLIGNPEINQAGEPVEGVLLAHSTKRDEVYDAGIRLKPNSSAFICFRGFPEGASFAL